MGNLWLVLLLTICLTEVVHGFCYFRRGIFPTDCLKTEYCCGLGKFKRCCQNGEVDNSPLIIGLCVGVPFGLTFIGIAIFGCWWKLCRRPD